MNSRLLIFQGTSIIVAMFFLLSCQEAPKEPETTQWDKVPWEQPWDSIKAHARGTKVRLMMWMGDPLINEFMGDFMTGVLKKEHGIELEISSGQGNQIVNHLIAEKEAGNTESAIDLVWINGETFYQLREIDALAGPFVDSLPNAQWIDMDNPFINQDFQQAIDGMECPWGNVQMAFIYDTVRTTDPPAGFAELETWVTEHPGKFTIPLEFTGMTLLKSWMMSLAEDPEVFYGDFNEETYLYYSEMLWEKINEMKANFWREGKAFPESLSVMHQMFASGELEITFSNNEAEVDNKMITGLFPRTVKAYFPTPGTIQNSHYLGLVKGGPNPIGALYVMNVLLDPEYQYQKMSPGFWGDGTVLDLDSLPGPWPERFQNPPNRINTPKRIPGRAYREPAPEYMIRIYKDFRKFVTDAE